jgi:mRNA interferase RelE/StbE
MIYQIEITKYAEKKVKKLDNNLRNEIIREIYALGSNPRPFGYKKLKGRDAYRIRMGDYRIIYEIFDKKLVISIIDVGHRKEIYD